MRRLVPPVRFLHSASDRIRFYVPGAAPKSASAPIVAPCIRPCTSKPGSTETSVIPGRNSTFYTPDSPLYPYPLGPSGWPFGPIRPPPLANVGGFPPSRSKISITNRVRVRPCPSVFVRVLVPLVFSPLQKTPPKHHQNYTISLPPPQSHSSIWSIPSLHRLGLSAPAPAPREACPSSLDSRLLPYFLPCFRPASAPK
jgi:hypothetical protein